MKVVNIISDTNVGGAGKCLVNYANNLKDSNIDLYVVVPKGSFLISYFKKSVKVIEIDGLYDKSLDIKSVFKLIKLLKDIKPDIVHTHAVIIARIVSRIFLKCKIIYTKHCYYELKKCEYNCFTRWVHGLFDKFFSDKIIIVTEALRNNMIMRGVASDKMITIVNGVPKVKGISLDRKNFIRKKYGIKENDFVVSIIARLVKDKDHETFIKTVLEFKKRKINDIKFLIVGTGELLEQLNSMVSEYGLENMVIFTGFINNIEDILCITSLQVNCSIGTETSSLSILEGYSLGIPAVASNYGGNPYIVLDSVTGYTFNIRDYKNLFKKVNKIKNDNKLYNNFSSNAMKIYNDKFQIDRYVNEISQCYYDVLKR